MSNVFTKVYCYKQKICKYNGIDKDIISISFKVGQWYEIINRFSYYSINYKDDVINTYFHIDISDAKNNFCTEQEYRELRLNQLLNEQRR